MSHQNLQDEVGFLDPVSIAVAPIQKLIYIVSISTEYGAKVHSTYSIEALAITTAQELSDSCFSVDVGRHALDDVDYPSRQIWSSYKARRFGDIFRPRPIE